MGAAASVNLTEGLQHANQEELKEALQSLDDTQRNRVAFACGALGGTCLACASGAPEEFRSVSEEAHKQLHEHWQAFQLDIATWLEIPFATLDAGAMEDSVKVLRKKLILEVKIWRKCPQFRAVRDKFKEWQVICVLLGELRDPCLRPRHWQQVIQAIGCELPTDQQIMKVGDLVDAKISMFQEQIEDICDAAKQERKVEVTLDRVEQLQWDNAASASEFMSLFEDWLCCYNARYRTQKLDELLQQMKGHCVTMQKCLRMWDQVQRRFERLKWTVGCSVDILSHVETDMEAWECESRKWQEILGSANKSPKAVFFFCNEQFEKLQELHEYLRDCEVSLFRHVASQHNICTLLDWSKDQVCLLLNLAQQLPKTAEYQIFPDKTTQEIKDLEYVAQHFDQFNQVNLSTDFVMDWYAAGLLLPHLHREDDKKDSESKKLSLELTLGMAWNPVDVLSDLMHGLGDTSQLPISGLVVRIKRILVKSELEKLCNLLSQLLAKLPDLRELNLLDSPGVVGYWVATNFGFMGDQLFNELRHLHLKTDWWRKWSCEDPLNDESGDLYKLSEESMMEQFTLHAKGVGCALKRCPKLENLTIPGLFSARWTNGSSSSYCSEVKFKYCLEALEEGLGGRHLPELQRITLDTTSYESECDVLSIEDGKLLGNFLGRCCPRVPQIDLNREDEQSFLHYCASYEEENEEERDICLAIQTGYDQIGSLIVTLIMPHSEAASDTEVQEIRCMNAAGNEIAVLRLDPQQAVISEVRKLVASSIGLPWSKVHLLLPNGEFLDREKDDVILASISS